MVPLILGVSFAASSRVGTVVSPVALIGSVGAESYVAPCRSAGQRRSVLSSQSNVAVQNTTGARPSQ
jgi:hypothetical protein